VRIERQKHKWIEGQIDGWTDRWTDEQMDRQMDRLTGEREGRREEEEGRREGAGKEGKMHGWMDRQMDGWMDGWTDGWVDEWMGGWVVDGWIKIERERYRDKGKNERREEVRLQGEREKGGREEKTNQGIYLLIFGSWRVVDSPLVT
jgi:hypothetical protein